MEWLCGSACLPASVFFVWRLTSVTRGARKRDAKLAEILHPISQKLADKETVTKEEIAVLSRLPQYRPMLYDMLKHFDRLDLFPEAGLTMTAQGEGVLAYWMMHPNELQDAPETMELVEVLDRDLAGMLQGIFNGTIGKFLVFRYRMPQGHWAGSDWLLGLAGPFIEKNLPYSAIVSAFSRCGDKFGEVAPTELVDWYIGIMTRKTA